MWSQSSDNVIWNSTLHLSLKFIYTAQLSNMLTRFHCNNFIILIPCRSTVDLPPNTNVAEIVRYEAEALSEWIWVTSTRLFSTKSVSVTQKFCFWHSAVTSLWKLYLTKQKPYWDCPVTRWYFPKVHSLQFGMEYLHTNFAQCHFYTLLCWMECWVFLQQTDYCFALRNRV
jgi:hypothetical protein